MIGNEYLQKILESQTLDPNGKEMKELRERRDAVETKLRENFGSGPSIRYGGSKAKGTMIKDAYDLDLICYFDNEDTSAGETLQEIYETVAEIFEGEYYIERKPSAIRLKSSNSANFGEDYHTDVVPGRFVDDNREDVFLYRSSGEKGRQKTNLDVHIKHVKGSGVADKIRLMKLWRSKNQLSIRHFVLELLVIDILKNKKNLSLTDSLKLVWTELRDNIDEISVEDPANPYGNDLSELLNAQIRFELSNIADQTLQKIENDGWENIFGEVPEENKSKAGKFADFITSPRSVSPSSSYGE